jgi:type I restriction enzyme S subunit
MSAPAGIDLSPDQRRIAIDILREHLPPGSKAWVFGSRATGRARQYSDLDLAIDAGQPLTLDQSASLAEAFGDSDLPYRVDVVDLRAIDERFRQVIAAARLPLTIDDRAESG